MNAPKSNAVNVWRENGAAKPIPSDQLPDTIKARNAAAGLREASRGLTLNGLKIKVMVNEGRR